MFCHPNVSVFNIEVPDVSFMIVNQSLYLLIFLLLCTDSEIPIPLLLTMLFYLKVKKQVLMGKTIKL